MFYARRSVPSIIISHNAFTFEAANKTLGQLYNDDAVKNHFSANNVEWPFIVKRAPGAGGFCERMIGLTNIALRKNPRERLRDLEGTSNNDPPDIM